MILLTTETIIRETQISDFISNLAERREEEIIIREGYALPIEKVKELLSSLEYGSCNYVMTLWLALTGCRIRELDNMTVQGFKGSYFFWKIGKNQKGHRRVKIPQYAFDALMYYRSRERVYKNQLFHKSGETYRRQMNKHRKLFGSEWTAKISNFKNNSIRHEDFMLQWKGFRKTYMTFKFYKNWDKYGDPHIATLAVTKEVGHGSIYMTFNHYIEDGTNINIRKWLNYDYENLFRPDHVQAKLGALLG